jgi:FkbH-like protein
MELRNLKKIITEKATSIAGCVAAAAEIDKYAESGKISRKKIAVLSNFTLNGIAEALKTNAFLNNIFIDVYLGNYGQWQQELMSNNLYDFAPEIIFVILDRFGIDSDIYNSYHLMPEEEIESYFKNYLAEIYKLVDAAKEKTKAKIVVSNIVDFWSNILGIAEGRAKNSLRRYIKRANLSLEQKYANDHQVLVFDFDGWLGYRGKEQNMYAKFFFLADMRLNPEIMPALAKELCAYLIAVFGKTKKCLVLDLDNTLWGGIIGEDGLSGISLAPHGAGQEFYLFQKTILAFHRRGIILAINSKNNWEDAMEVFEKHPHMILKREHFAAMRINWQDKIANFRELAEEINIGLDSMVFADDDPANRAMVNEFLPEVDILDVPGDTALYFKALLDYKGFSILEFTEEDKKRGEMYFAESQRREIKSQATDLDSFLRGLDLAISIEPISELTLPRAAQLTQKTNQFNLTTCRYQVEDIKNFISNGYKIWTLSAKDRFGNYGMTGLLIARKEKENWAIGTFLLSCRILGKRIEEQFLNFALNELKSAGVKKVLAEYIATKKNGQVKDFYGKMGFKKISSEENKDVWQVDLSNFEFKPLDFIAINQS